MLTGKRFNDFSLVEAEEFLPVLAVDSLRRLPDPVLNERVDVDEFAHQSGGDHLPDRGLPASGHADQDDV